jgi:hypothetical protein
MPEFFSTYFGIEPSVANIVWSLLLMIAGRAFLWLRQSGWLDHERAYWIVSPMIFLILISALSFAARGGAPVRPAFRIQPIDMTFANTPKLPNTIGVILGLDLFNNGSDAVATNWSLAVSVPDEFSDRKGDLTTIPDLFTITDSTGKSHVYKASDALYEKTMQIIHRGGVVPGILFFTFHDTSEESLNRTDAAYVLSWTDSEGRPWTYKFKRGDFNVSTQKMRHQPGLEESDVGVDQLSGQPSQ